MTLNPVVARSTQALLPDYIRFVLERLPRVRSVSLSAVQPHGRAAHDPSLLPDYDVLAPMVREARALAEAAGLELLNPYCGLPACVGWADGLARSVEAIEAREGGWRTTPGIENRATRPTAPIARAACFGPFAAARGGPTGSCARAGDWCRRWRSWSRGREQARCRTW